ncbi:MAG: glycosyltransferase [Thermoleophilaceae bacterium]
MPARGRILHVLQADPGGAPQHVLRLTGGLADRGWRVEVAVDPRSGIHDRLASAGVGVHLLPGSKRRPGLADLKVGRALRALQREHRYAIVHAHSSKSGAVARSCLQRSTPVVYTPHCFPFAAGFSAPERAAYRAIEQALVPRSAAIVVVSDWERRQGVRLRGAERKLRLIENGVPACEQVAPSAELEEFKDERPLAGFVSPLRPVKDPLVLVRAMSLLANRGRAPGRLAIVGNGPLRQAVESEIAERGLQADVRCFSFEDGPYGYLRSIDLLVLPSLWESLPLAPLEAMSCGVPVLATRVGGLPELVREGETGALVAPAAPEELASRLERLLGDREQLARMGAAARAQAERRFGLDTMVERTAALYEELIGAPAAA